MKEHLRHSSNVWDIKEYLRYSSNVWKMFSVYVLLYNYHVSMTLGLVEHYVDLAKFTCDAALRCAPRFLHDGTRLYER